MFQFFWFSLMYLLDLIYVQDYSSEFCYYQVLCCDNILKRHSHCLLIVPMFFQMFSSDYDCSFNKPTCSIGLGGLVRYKAVADCSFQSFHHHMLFWVNMEFSWPCCIAYCPVTNFCTLFRFFLRYR